LDLKAFSQSLHLNGNFEFSGSELISIVFATSIGSPETAFGSLLLSSTVDAAA
jgi:hypothetical protein